MQSPLKARESDPRDFILNQYSSLPMKNQKIRDMEDIFRKSNSHVIGVPKEITRMNKRKEIIEKQEQKMYSAAGRLERSH